MSSGYPFFGRPHDVFRAVRKSRVRSCDSPPAVWPHVQRTNSNIQPDYVIHCYGRSEGVAGIIITKEYPTIAAHSVLSKLMDQFLAEKPLATINAAKTDNSVPFPALKDFIRDYQDPNNASSIAKIQQELDETKIILHKAIDSVCYGSGDMEIHRY